MPAGGEAPQQKVDPFLFVERNLTEGRSSLLALILCGRPHGPLCAPNHRDAAYVVPSRAVLDWPQSDIVYPHDQRAARHAARQGLGKFIRDSLLHPRGCRVADVYPQRRDINLNIADRKARLRQSVSTRDRREKPKGAACTWSASIGVFKTRMGPLIPTAAETGVPNVGRSP
jgi:hypothetical protein